MPPSPRIAVPIVSATRQMRITRSVPMAMGKARSYRADNAEQITGAAVNAGDDGAGVERVQYLGQDRADAADRGPQIEPDRRDRGDGPTPPWQSAPPFFVRRVWS